jgi:hypothetical protein
MVEAIATIKQIFEEKYAPWGLILPIDPNPKTHKGNLEDESGWAIAYCYHPEADPPYLEFLVSHRMTNDTLQRIYADGRQELVGSCWETYAANDPAAKQAYFDHNRQFYDRVREGGLS